MAALWHNILILLVIGVTVTLQADVNTTATSTTASPNSTTTAAILDLNVTSTTTTPAAPIAQVTRDPNDNSTEAWILCEPGNSKMRKYLGCDCKYPYATPKTELIADCHAQTLGTEDTLLPQYLNVSIHVRTLNFGHNFVLGLSGDTFGNVDGVTELIFSNNLIHNVKDLNFPRLSKLDLSHNLMTNLTADAFWNSSKIQDLDLSFNHLTFIESNVFSHLTFLKTLNLASNHIGMAVEYYDEYPFQLSHLEFLVELNLNNNSIQEFPTNILAGTKNLKRLFLKNNKLFSIPSEEFFPKELASLEELDLSGNLFNVISPNEFNGFIALQKLTLDGNRELTMIEEFAFSGLPNLRELSCEHNHRLTFIDSAAFNGDPDVADSSPSSPKIVRLSDNSLAYIEFPLLPWKDLEVLDLSRNPWYCDCNLQWVPSFRLNKKEETAIFMDSDFICFGPTPLKGVSVASGEPEEMLCFSATTTVAGIIGISIFTILLITFCILVALSAIGVVPNYFKKFNICSRGNDLPKYSRVNPKPNGRRNLDTETPGDLEWDSADIGR